MTGLLALSPAHVTGTQLLLTLLAVVIFSRQTRQVAGSGVFQLQIGSFQNDLSVTADGRCCQAVDGKAGSRRSKDAVGLRCSGACRTFFNVCLGHYQSDAIDDVIPAVGARCTYGSLTTPVVSHQNSSSTDTVNVPDWINFTFDFTWPGTFSLVIEAWHDITGNGPDPGSQRILISRVKLQRFLDASDVWRQEDHHVTGSSSNNSITKPTWQLRLAYRVVCDATFFGPGCERTCVPRDDRFGHYDCDDVTGNRICHRGWNGTYCDQAMCIEGCQGYCELPDECRCRPGWQGALCDQCVVYPGCQHGSCLLPWQCNCHDGWGGLFCNQDLNYCTTHRPCQHGGTCIHTGLLPVGGAVPFNDDGIATDHHSPVSISSPAAQLSYRCSCRHGYVGPNCETVTTTTADADLADVTEFDAYLDCRGVTEHGCLNGGVCVQQSPDADAPLFACRCQPGYSGSRCETSISSSIGNDGTGEDNVDTIECKKNDTEISSGQQPRRGCGSRGSSSSNNDHSHNEAFSATESTTTANLRMTFKLATTTTPTPRDHVWINSTRITANEVDAIWRIGPRHGAISDAELEQLPEDIVAKPMTSQTPPSSTSDLLSKAEVSTDNYSSRLVVTAIGIVVGLSSLASVFLLSTFCFQQLRPIDQQQSPPPPGRRKVHFCSSPGDNGNKKQGLPKVFHAKLNNTDALVSTICKSDRKQLDSVDVQHCRCFVVDNNNFQNEASSSATAVQPGDVEYPGRCWKRQITIDDGALVTSALDDRLINVIFREESDSTRRSRLDKQLRQYDLYVV